MYTSVQNLGSVIFFFKSLELAIFSFCFWKFFPTAAWKSQPFAENRRDHPRLTQAHRSREIDSAVRGSPKPAVSGERQPAVHGSPKPAAVRSHRKSAARGHRKPTDRRSCAPGLAGVIWGYGLEPSSMQCLCPSASPSKVLCSVWASRAPPRVRASKTPLLLQGPIQDLQIQDWLEANVPTFLGYNEPLLLLGWRDKPDYILGMGWAVQAMPLNSVQVAPKRQSTHPWAWEPEVHIHITHVSHFGFS